METRNFPEPSQAIRYIPADSGRWPTCDVRLSKCQPNAVFPNFRNPSRRRHLSVSTISRIVLMLWVAFKLQGNGANLDMDRLRRPSCELSNSPECLLHAKGCIIPQCGTWSFFLFCIVPLPEFEVQQSSAQICFLGWAISISVATWTKRWQTSLFAAQTTWTIQLSYHRNKINLQSSQLPPPTVANPQPTT
jgi:hypothetical protein